MRSYSIPVILLVLIASCSSTSRRDGPPDLRNGTLLEGNASESYRWWRTYKLAKEQINQDTEKSCRNFSNLSEQIDFPLQPVAELYAISSCAKVGKNIPLPQSSPPWLKKLRTESELDWLMSFQPGEELADLLHEKSKLALPMNEKIELVKQAQTYTKSPIKKEKWQKRIYKLAPRLIKKPDQSKWFQVAKDFSRQRHFEMARYYFRRIIRSPSTSWHLKREAYNRLAKTYKLQTNNKLYLRELKKLQRFVKKQIKSKNSVYIRDYFNVSIRVARRHWTIGERSKAKRELNRLIKVAKGRLPLGKIYWLLGRIAEEQKKYDVAIDYFDKAIANSPSSSATQVYLWSRAWNLRKTDNLHEALHDFAEIIADNESSRASYWHAVTLRDLNMDQAAMILFKQLAKSDAFGYYGVLAQRETGDVFAKMPPSKDLIPDSIDADDLNILDWLVSVGELKIAQSYIGHLDEKYPELKRIERLGLYARSGIYLPLFVELGKIESTERKNLLAQYPQLLFPQPYQSEVKSAAERFAIDPALIYSIIRQESAFNPRARSHADAFGLMQLLEPIAQKYAQQNDVYMENFDDLYRAETNITLGSALLKDLFAEQKGFIPAVASYNANKNAIRRWIKTRFDGNAIEFIEDVPYQETQQYIQLVMRNYVFYQRMADPEKPLFFPEWCLKNIQDVKS